MLTNEDLETANILNRISINIIKMKERYDRYKARESVHHLTKTMKKNKKSLRKNVSRKIKRLKNILKSTKQVNPCLISALAEQEKCILSEGNVGKSINKVLDMACTDKTVQDVIRNWNPDPTTHYDLFESDPDYEIKKKQREEGEGVGWFSTINGCGQSIENSLLDVSTLKDKRNNEKEKKRRAKLSPEQREAEDKVLQEFYRKHEIDNSNIDNQNNETLVAEKEIILGGKKKRKTRRKSRRKRKTRRKSRRKRKTRRKKQK